MRESKNLARVLFCLTFTLGAGGILHAEDKCKKYLEAEELAKLYTRALGSEFNTIYNFHHGDGTKKIREFFQAMDIEGQRNGDHAGMLRAILAHTRQGRGFTKRYYDGYAPSGVSLREETFYILEARILYLDGFLRKNRISQDPKLLAYLYNVLLADWHPQGFMAHLKFEDLGPTLEGALNIYRQNKADDDAPAVKTPSDVLRLAGKADRVDADDVFIFAEEGKHSIAAKLNKIDETQYSHVISDLPFHNFEQFAELETYHFYITRLLTVEGKRLVAAHIKGVEFLTSEITSPRIGNGNDDPVATKGKRTKTFLRNLSSLLNDKNMDKRFGSTFRTRAAEELAPYLREMQYHLMQGQARKDLIEDQETLSLLNRVLTAVGLPDVDLQ